jgi:hypothetical protein
MDREIFSGLLLGKINSGNIFYVHYDVTFVGKTNTLILFVGKMSGKTDTTVLIGVVRLGCLIWLILLLLYFLLCL